MFRDKQHMPCRDIFKVLWIWALCPAVAATLKHKELSISKAWPWMWKLHRSQDKTWNNRVTKISQKELRCGSLQKATLQMQGSLEHLSLFPTSVIKICNLFSMLLILRFPNAIHLWSPHKRSFPTLLILWVCSQFFWKGKWQFNMPQKMGQLTVVRKLYIFIIQHIISALWAFPLCQVFIVQHLLQDWSVTLQGQETFV